MVLLEDRHAFVALQVEAPPGEAREVPRRGTDAHGAPRLWSRAAARRSWGTAQAHGSSLVKRTRSPSLPQRRPGIFSREIGPKANQSRSCSPIDAQRTTDTRTPRGRAQRDHRRRSRDRRRRRPVALVAPAGPGQQRTRRKNNRWNSHWSRRDRRVGGQAHGCVRTVSHEGHKRVEHRD